MHFCHSNSHWTEEFAQFHTQVPHGRPADALRGSRGDPFDPIDSRQEKPAWLVGKVAKAAVRGGENDEFVKLCNY